jgi:prepilin peptidase CpaA
MLACYVFFTGGVGGGDVKLLAMVGAFLGPWRGLEALLWTFVLSACVAILLLVWRLGAWRLLLRTVQSVAHLAIFRSWPPLRGEEREQLKTDVFLSPSALVAVLIVQLQLSKWF